MTDYTNAVAMLIGACFCALTIGASFTFGVAIVCRRMKWGPVQMTINIYNVGDADPVGSVRND